MLNTRSLTHPTMVRKIDAAMRDAAAMSYADAWERRNAKWVPGQAMGYARVTNRKGVAVMTLRHHRGEANAFQFWRGNRNITSIVLAALRRSNGA